jgi:hypothetical protein
MKLERCMGGVVDDGPAGGGVLRSLGVGGFFVVLLKSR